MNAAELEELAALAEALKARQESEDDAGLLPKVGLEDIPAELNIPSGTSSNGATPLPVTWYTPGTNGLFYHQLIVELPALADSELELLPLFCDCVTEVGCGDPGLQRGRYTAGENRQAEDKKAKWLHNCSSISGRRGAGESLDATSRNRLAGLTTLPQGAANAKHPAPEV